MADKGGTAAERFSLKDHLFNAETLGDLAREHAVLPGFDPERFLSEVLPGLEGRELLARLDWIADCLERQLPQDFPAMADALEAAMLDPLDPSLRDDDFGRFIHAVPGILAVRHGLEDHRERALDLLYQATQRFSMEFYIRPFLNRWPEETLARLRLWAEDGNYHVRRLVSEGTRPKLPWAKKIDLDLLTPLPLLDALYGDPTRYVTRSVANHLNDIAKVQPDVVMDRLEAWRAEGRQTDKELAWMTTHALRTLVKQGHPRAMGLVGYDPALSVDVRLDLPQSCAIGGVMPFAVTLSGPAGAGVLVDYVLELVKAGGQTAPKVFKLKQAKLGLDGALRLDKNHRFKGDATTFTLHPGRQVLKVQVNGVIRAAQAFELTV
ncbi:hypothetical protein [Pseudaestuariivita sp.]|uniref:hypothetical protein n=1 Tax=Pseudaestuariivita sp. TaxID=2211669 RepID=UPI0040587711